MWKFQYFSLTQILREINFEDSRNAKIAVFALLVSVDFVHLVKIRKIGAKIHEKSKFRASKCVKIADFALQESPKLISRKI